jgi:hypothetical protein
MTLFEKDADPAAQLCRYFDVRGAKVVLVRAGDDAPFVRSFLRVWWDEASKAAEEDDLVMIVQGDSYELAPSLWTNNAGSPNPDLVFVDPYNLEDSAGQPTEILVSLNASKVPSMCWTPLFCVPPLAKGGPGWQPDKWSFEDCQNQQFRTGVGDKKAHDFLTYCQKNKYLLAWFSWEPTSGGRQALYGCQLAIDGVFNVTGLSPAQVWQFAGNPGQLPYLDIGGQVGSPHSSGINLRNPATMWQTWGSLNPQGSQITPAAQGPPGKRWDPNLDYSAAFWWP